MCNIFFLVFVKRFRSAYYTVFHCVFCFFVYRNLNSWLNLYLMAAVCVFWLCLLLPFTFTLMYFGVNWWLLHILNHIAAFVFDSLFSMFVKVIMFPRVQYRNFSFCKYSLPVGREQKLCGPKMWISLLYIWATIWDWFWITMGTQRM
jgi:hypothetical protein